MGRCIGEGRLMGLIAMLNPGAVEGVGAADVVCVRNTLVRTRFGSVFVLKAIEAKVTLHRGHVLVKARMRNGCSSLCALYWWVCSFLC